PRSIGMSRLPYTSPVLGYLDPPSFSLRSIPDSGAITNYFHACFPHAASRPYSLTRSLVALSQALLDPHEGSGRYPGSLGTCRRQLRLSRVRPTGGRWCVTRRNSIEAARDCA